MIAWLASFYAHASVNITYSTIRNNSAMFKQFVNSILEHYLIYINPEPFASSYIIHQTTRSELHNTRSTYQLSSNLHEVV